METAKPLSMQGTVLRCAAIAVFIAFFAIVFYFRMRTHSSPETILLDGSWDDGRTFYSIAKQGYRGLPISEYRELGFYPLVVACLIPFLGVYSVFAVSLAASIASGILLYLILRRWYTSDAVAFHVALVLSVARQPLFFMGFIKWGLPSMTVLLSIESSESLYLLLVLLAFWCFKTDRYKLAFVLAGLSTVTRATGGLVAGAFLLELLHRRDWRNSAWFAVPVLLIVAHFGYFYWAVGDFFAFFKGHAHFYPNGSMTWPFHDLVRLLNGQYRDIWEPASGWVFIYAYFLVGLAILARRDRLLFWMNAPSFLLFVCLDGWAIHGRYYETLFGVHFAYVLLAARWAPGLQSSSPATETAHDPETALLGSP